MAKGRIVAILVLFIIVTALTATPILRFAALVRILPVSYRTSGFYNWSRQLQRIRAISASGEASEALPAAPTLLLANHIASHYGLGSFLALAHTVRRPCRIVCYTSYHHLAFVTGPVHSILGPEIRIDHRADKGEKERLMVQGIRETLASGQDVYMFIDAHSAIRPMRTLNRVVLEQFPDTPKQLVHLIEPCGANHFRFTRHAPTMDVAEIIRTRRRLIGLAKDLPDRAR